VFAAYNAITAEKDVVVRPYSGHEVPTAYAERQLAEFARVLG
jgi:cephalosporin-C deacetylase-like acetyl esterase